MGSIVVPQQFLATLIALEIKSVLIPHLRLPAVDTVQEELVKLVLQIVELQLVLLAMVMIPVQATVVVEGIVFSPKCTSPQCCDLNGNCVDEGNWGDGIRDSDIDPCTREYCYRGTWYDSMCLRMGTAYSSDLQDRCDPNNWRYPCYTIPRGAPGRCINGTCRGLQVCRHSFHHCVELTFHWILADEALVLFLLASLQSGAMVYPGK